MEITARKKSTDPVQEALRSHKDKWNLAAKEFIARVIAFKRAMNGRGDAKYGLPPGNIKEHLPEQVTAFLSTLSSNYEQLASEALQIEQQQAAYSQTRRKPKPKGAPGMPKAEVPSQLQNEVTPTQSAGQPVAKAASMQKVAFQKNTAKLRIGAHGLDTLLAETEEEQEQGLMGRGWPPPPMSFVYSAPRVNRFWMKNTPSPLDIIFSLNGVVTSIHKGEPHSTRLIGNWELSDLVVELPQGSVSKMGIKIGDPIVLQKTIKDLSTSLENKYALKY